MLGTACGDYMGGAWEGGLKLKVIVVAVANAFADLARSLLPYLLSQTFKPLNGCPPFASISTCCPGLQLTVKAVISPGLPVPATQERILSFVSRPTRHGTD
jgi:hypothetical protein